MSSSKQRKNILLISLDDAIAFWHYRNVFGIELQTPNLDRICAASTAFHSAYCQAPICGPSRASFMSGKTPHQSGCFENKNKFYEHIEPRDMWPYLLKQSGYFCSSGGKMHHGYKPLPTETYEALYSDPPKRFSIIGTLPPKLPHVKYGGWRGGFAFTKDVPEDTLYDVQSANSAIEFLESYDDDQPFYREVGFFSPHGPFLTTEHFKDLYDFRGFHHPKAWAQPYDRNTYADKHLYENFDRSKYRFWRLSVRNYFSALTQADHHIGRVWDALKASSHAENTIVILVADHGFHLGERNRFRKTTLWEQVANVPLIVHDPSAPNGQIVKDPVAMIDVGQTVLDFAGLPSMESCVGQSLRPYLSGAGEKDRTVPTFHHDNVGIRHGKYRLIRYEDGSTQFYDLEEDPWQFVNLGENHPAFAAAFEALSATSQDYGLELRQTA